MWEEVTARPVPESKRQKQLPAFFSWMNYNPTTGNFANLPAGKYVTNFRCQMQCGSCWAFAAINTFEGAYQIALKDPHTQINMSTQILVSCSSNMGCNGGWGSTTANFLETKGTWNEGCFPYVAEDKPCGDACPDYPAKAYKISDWHSVSQNVEALKSALYEYGPLYTAMSVYDDFRHYYQGGIYELTPGSQSLGGHAIAIVGYNDDEQCFIVKNSWDRLSWDQNPPQPWGEAINGDPGYFRIHYNQVNSSVGFGRSTIAFVYKP